MIFYWFCNKSGLADGEIAAQYTAEYDALKETNNMFDSSCCSPHHTSYIQDRISSKYNVSSTSAELS